MAQTSGLKSKSAREFRMHAYPKPELIVNPWFPIPSVVMLFAKAGSGKTYVTLGFALSVAAGWPLLDFQIRQAKRVLYVDGEMPAPHQQVRLNKLQKAHSFPEWAWDNLFILSQTDFENGIPDLAPADSRGRRLIEKEAIGVNADVIMLDNYSSLFHSTDDNAAEAHQSTNDWLISLRTKGYAVLLIDHAGKEGDGKSKGPRGSSKKTDIADCVIELKQKAPGPQYPIKWVYQKVRHFQPDAQNAGFQFVLNFSEQDSQCKIERIDTAEMNAEVEELLEEQAGGKSIRAIAQENGISKSAMHRWLQKAGQDVPGRIKKSTSGRRDV